MWANPSEVPGKGLTWPTPQHTCCHGGVISMPPKFPLAFISKVRRAKGSVKGKYLPKEELVQHFQSWINSYVHSHSKENLPYWNPCWFLTSKPSIHSSTKNSGLTFPGTEQLKHIIPFKAPWPCSSTAWAWAGAGVESNPFTRAGRDFPALQIHIQALEKGHICSILLWSEAAAAGHSWTLTPDSFTSDSQDKCEATSALAPLPGTHSNQTLEQVQLIKDRTLRKCKNTGLSEECCKVHFLGVFGQQSQCLQFPQMGTLTQLCKKKVF